MHVSHSCYKFYFLKVSSCLGPCLTEILLQSYIDPSNGSKFYSKPEVLRYLKTVRRKSRIANDVKSVKGNIFKKKSGISMLSAGEVCFT